MKKYGPLLAGGAGTFFITALFSVLLKTSPIFRDYRKLEQYTQSGRGFAIGWIVLIAIAAAILLYRFIRKAVMKHKDCDKEPWE